MPGRFIRVRRFLWRAGQHRHQVRAGTSLRAGHRQPRITPLGQPDPTSQPQRRHQPGRPDQIRLIERCRQPADPMKELHLGNALPGGATEP